MSASNPGRFEVPTWVYVAAAVALVLILGGFLWSGPSSESGRIGTDSARAEPVAPLRVTSTQPPGAISPSAVVKQTDPVTVSPTPREKRKCAVKKPVVKPVTPREMFPMGSVTRDMPYAPHPYRPAHEGFASFGYGERIWSFTGRFAKGGQVDLAPTGFSLNGRRLMAIANTAGPGSVLFLQSSRDPGRFAIYRHK